MFSKEVLQGQERKVKSQSTCRCFAAKRTKNWKITRKNSTMEWKNLNVRKLKENRMFDAKCGLYLKTKLRKINGISNSIRKFDLWFF